MAHKKAGGTAKNLRDSGPQYLGIKLYGGESALPGNVIVRQRGTVYVPGAGVKLSKDHSIYAVREGKVEFKDVRKVRFDGKKRTAKQVSII